MPFVFAEVPMKAFLNFVWDMFLGFAVQFAAIAAIAVALGFLVLAVYGHKRNWKQE